MSFKFSFSLLEESSPPNPVPPISKSNPLPPN